jgi:outer membrane protein assembly factor BamA
MLMVRVVVIVLALFQASPVMEVAGVELVGAKRFGPSDVVQLSELPMRKAVTVADLNAAAQRLANTGFFESVKYRYTLAGRRVTVIFEVQEIPWTVPVSFDNFIWFSNEELTQAVRRDFPTFDATLPKSHEMPERMIRSLQQLLDNKRIAGRVEFSPEGTLSGEIVQYIFAVKDPAPKLCGVRITGASVIPEQELVAAVRSGSGTDYSRFSVTNIAKGTLVDLYRRRGYWRASFAPPVTSLEEGASCAGANVTLAVTEGSAYTFAGTQWSGNTVIAAAQLDAVFGMKPGDLADVTAVEAGQRAARRAYGRVGYLAMRSSYSPRLDDEAKRAVFDVQVTEGPQFRMGSLEIVGLPEADADALRAKWLLKAGDAYDEEYPREFQSKEIAALMRARRGSGKPPQVQTRPDGATRVVNVRIVSQ